MYKVIAIIVLIFVIITLAKIYLNRKWKLIFTTFGHENYFKVVAKLKNAGVKYKIKTPLNVNDRQRFNDNSQYDIYVKKEEEHLAQRAMHQSD
ncbi:hypothetical protein [Bacillus sp. CECT 9360]|uniref:hypothetical protein n=1 Tax=Bacillus sp. CECT 9360 TaxID=2845821 RepID=UPI001E52CC17|nr:hypothetical protein [Bacillus sp. CECT 9360]CAH0346631.1 hypothetical protein BCI9360_02974 [Bacillus sp. CECT 9360]